MNELFRPLLFVCALLALCLSVDGQKPYFPTLSAWKRRTPEQAGFDPAKLKEAIDFAIASESKAPRNLELALYQTFGREPFGGGVGALKERGPATGIIIRGGRIVAEWGEAQRVDMTFSVTKSFLSAPVGMAFDMKLIRSLQDKVSDYSAPVSVANRHERFDTAENFGKA